MEENIPEKINNTLKTKKKRKNKKKKSAVSSHKKTNSPEHFNNHDSETNKEVGSNDVHPNENSSSAVNIDSSNGTDRKRSDKWSSITKQVINNNGNDDSLDGRRVSFSQGLGSSLLEDVNQGNIDNWDPEACVLLLRMPSVNNFTGMKKLILQANAEWTEEFLSLGGLGVLFEATERVSSLQSTSISNAFLQLECVLCIKALLNSVAGLEYITSEKNYAIKFAKALYTNNVLVKKQVFELLSAISVYSKNGYRLAFSTLDNYKSFHGKRFRFGLITTELSNADVCHYTVSLLAFMNCLIFGEHNLLRRCAVRNELIGLELLSILEGLKESLNNDVILQLKAFQDAYLEDNSQILATYSTGLNHYDVFNSIFSKIKDSPNSYKLLSLLHNLDCLEFSKESDDIWNEIENLSITALNSGSKSRITSKIQRDTRTSVCTQTSINYDSIISLDTVMLANNQQSKGNLTEVLMQGQEIPKSNHSIYLQRSKEVNLDTALPPNYSCVQSTSNLAETASLSLNSEKILTSTHLHSQNNEHSVMLPNSTIINNPPLLPDISEMPHLSQLHNSMGIPPAPPMPNLSRIPQASPLLNSTGIPPPPPLPNLIGIPHPPPLPNSVRLACPPQLTCLAPIPLPPTLHKSTGIPPPPPLPGVSAVPISPQFQNSSGIPPPPPLPCLGGMSNSPLLPNSTGIQSLPSYPNLKSVSSPLLPHGTFIPPPPPLPNSTGIQTDYSNIEPNVVTVYPNYKPSISNAVASLSRPLIIQVLSSRIPKPSIKMKRVNWAKVNYQMLSNSVWSEIITEFDNFAPKDVNYIEIERLFCQSSPIKKAVEPTKPKISKESFLDSKTSLNLSIFLKQFKSQPEEVASYIKNVQEHRIGSDSLQGLLKILPDKKDALCIRGYEGDVAKLSPPDIFLYHIYKIPSYDVLIKGMILKTEFEPSISLINQNLTSLLEICKAILDSLSIKLFLAHVLTLGNFLNTDSYAGNAAGFKLSTITKLWETRGNKVGVTFLHYAIDNVHSSILEFVDELKNDFNQTSRLSVDGMKTEFEELSRDLNVTNEIVRTTADEYLPHFQNFLTKGKNDVEQLEIKCHELENIRLKLATYFCEEESKFRIEECIGTFHALCIKVQLFTKENEDRKKREEKRRRLEEQSKMEESSGKAVKKSRRKIPVVSEESVIDTLLNEIKKGNFKLRTTSAGSES